MATTYELTRKDITRLLKAIARPIKNITSFWKILHVMIQQAVDLAFRTEGRSNGKGWVGYSRGKGHILGGSTRMKSGTWRIRYGTQLSGRAKGTYTPGKLRPGVKRYSEKSKLLQAYGGFKRSFGKIALTNRHLIYGTVHRLAKQIMSDPDRPVLVVTNRLINLWQKRFVMWYRKGLKFT